MGPLLVLELATHLVGYSGGITRGQGTSPLGLVFLSAGWLGLLLLVSRGTSAQAPLIALLENRLLCVWQ